MNCFALVSSRLHVHLPERRRFCDLESFILQPRTSIKGALQRRRGKLNAKFQDLDKEQTETSAGQQLTPNQNGSRKLGGCYLTLFCRRTLDARGRVLRLAYCSDEEALAVPSSTDSEDTVSRLTALAVLLSPFFFWGTSMVAMKALSPHTAPLFVSAVRLLPAGLALIAWAAWDNRPQPTGFKAWLWIGLFGLADATCFQGFLAEGLQRTTAGLGSVIIDSQPLTVAVLAAILFGEQLTSLGILGLAMGVLGLCLLEASPELFGPMLNNALSGVRFPLIPSLWESGEFYMLLAAQSMAVGTILVRYVSKYADPIMATGYHMILGGIPLLLLSAQKEAPLLMARLPMLTGTDILLLVYISLLGSAASYGVFFLNATRGNLTALSSLTFSTPLFAALTGFFVFGETLTTLQLSGALVTLVGVYLISRPPAKESS